MEEAKIHKKVQKTLPMGSYLSKKAHELGYK
jgi:hypothetical protein